MLEINAYNRNDGRFVDALRGLLAEPRYAALARWVTAIDVSHALGPDDYYVLDGHMNRPPVTKRWRAWWPPSWSDGGHCSPDRPPARSNPS